MSKLTIVANIHADPDKIDLAKDELEKLIPITRAEEGCIRYDYMEATEGAVAEFTLNEMTQVGW